MTALPPIPPTPPDEDPSASHTEPDLSSQNSLNNSTTRLPIPSTSSTDVASLSTHTQDLTPYLRVMSQIQEVRQARIQHIQAAIDTNSYLLSAENLADALLQELNAPPNTPDL